MKTFDLDRRTLIAATAALAAAPAVAARAPAGNKKVAATLQTIADALLQRAPEQATLLGVDNGKNAGLASKLGDLSAAGAAEDRRTVATARKLLDGLPGDLQGADINNVAAARFALETAAEGERFGFGYSGTGGSIPYVVSQQNGTYQQAAEFLDSYHRIEDRAGADAYLARLGQVSANLDAETERMRADAGKGVVPPSYIIANILGQQTELRAIAAGESKFVASLARRSAKLGLPDQSADATAIVAEKIYPALERQIETLKSLRSNYDAGVWKLPDGEAYYQYLLKSQTTTTLSADEIHATGQEQNRAIEAEMDAILRKQGLTKGSVGERTAALTIDKRFLKPDSDAGRDAVLALVRGHVEAARPRMARLSKMNLKAPVEVKRVPVDIQDGASLGYMNFASTDGKRPAIYYINLKSMDYWPDWALASLTMHEALPGHAWQGAWLAENAAAASPLAQFIYFNAFVEGWALYAEQLIDEDGYYADDPFGRLGYLNAARYRAVRLIVDTGLHHLRWSRDKAIDVMVANTGRARAAIRSEIDRYCASPGQACGYKIGHNEILKQRARAKAALGAKWDVRDYNDALVQSGGVPLTQLPALVDRMIARVQAG